MCIKEAPPEGPEKSSESPRNVLRKSSVSSKEVLKNCSEFLNQGIFLRSLEFGGVFNVADFAGMGRNGKKQEETGRAGKYLKSIPKVSKKYP